MSNGQVAYDAFFEATKEAFGHSTYISFKDLSSEEQEVWQHIASKVVNHHVLLEHERSPAAVKSGLELVDEVERQAKLQGDMTGRFYDLPSQSMRYYGG